MKRLTELKFISGVISGGIAGAALLLRFGSGFPLFSDLSNFGNGVTGFLLGAMIAGGLLSGSRARKETLKGVLATLAFLVISYVIALILVSIYFFIKRIVT